MVTGVIAVRAGSRRVKNKNIRPFAGVNLLIHKIQQLKQVNGIDNILVTSDSDEMLDMGRENGTLTFKRGIEYCDEKTKSMGEVISHVCENITGDIIVWAPCTMPLIEPYVYTNALNKYYEIIKKGYDSLFTAEEFRRFLWDENGPLNYEPGVNQVPSQKLKPLYNCVGGIFIAPRKKMIEWKYYFGSHPYMYLLDRYSCVDIDDEFDLTYASILYSMRHDINNRGENNG